MSSRNVYRGTGITPEYTDFPTLHHSIPSGSSSRRHPENHEQSISNIGEGSVPSRMHSWLASAKDVWQMNTGLLLVVASQVFFSLMNVAVKMLNSIDPPVTVLELIAVRMTITYVCCITYMFFWKVPDPILGPKGIRLLLLFRGFSGFFGLFGIYFSLQYLSLSDATVLTFLSPMCTAIAGALFLGENFTLREAFAGLISLVGVVLIARPAVIFGAASLYPTSFSYPHLFDILPTNSLVTPTEAERLIAVGVALVGVLGATGAYTTIRAIGKRAHTLHSLTFFSSMCSVVSIGMFTTKVPIVIPSQIDWLALLFMIGIFGFIAQVLLTMGLQRETAGRGSMAIYTQIVFATIFEKIVFDAVPTVLSIYGTLLIILSASYVALTKRKQDPSIPKNIHLPEDVEEGFLNYLRAGPQGDKLLDCHVQFRDDEIT